MGAQLSAGNMGQGLRSLRDLTQHLTTRADDSHAPPVFPSPRGGTHFCFALRRIKPHTPPLVRAPVNSFEFQPCGRTPQAGRLLRLLRHGRGRYPPHLAPIVYGQDYRGI